MLRTIATSSPMLVLGVALLGGMLPARAVELPSVLQAGDMFCINEADFDDFASHGARRSNSGTETCSRIDRQVRVAVLSGHAGVKTMVRVASGPMAYSIGWTDSRLPDTR